MVQTRVRASQSQDESESGRVRTTQDESGQKYFIQSPMPLPVTIFQRPLDNFILQWLAIIHAAVF